MTDVVASPPPPPNCHGESLPVTLEAMQRMIVLLDDIFASSTDHHGQQQFFFGTLRFFGSF